MKYKKDVPVLAATCLCIALISCLELKVGPKRLIPGGHRTKLIQARLAIVPELDYTVTYKLGTVIIAIFATVLLIIGRHKKRPPWFVPWLAFCLNGFLTREIPFLIQFCRVVSVHMQVLPSVLLVACAQLFVLKLFMWIDILTVIVKTMKLLGCEAKPKVPHAQTSVRRSSHPHVVQKVLHGPKVVQGVTHEQKTVQDVLSHDRKFKQVQSQAQKAVEGVSRAQDWRLISNNQKAVHDVSRAQKNLCEECYAQVIHSCKPRHKSLKIINDSS